jgi:hypothetical protein
MVWGWQIFKKYGNKLATTKKTIQFKGFLLLENNLSVYYHTRWLLNRETFNKYAKFDSFKYLFPIKITNIKRESVVNDKSFTFYILLQPIFKVIAAIYAQFRKFREICKSIMFIPNVLASFQFRVFFYHTYLFKNGKIFSMGLRSGDREDH